MPEIAITTCTYNPSPEIFSQVLASFAKLKIPENTSMEGVIVDNNSTPPLSSFSYVREFLETCKWCKLVVETKQGKTFAVVRAVQETSADIVINFDDDNIAGEDYLINSLHLIKEYPKVGAWGPGMIKVAFTGDVKEWVTKYTLGFFQEKTTDENKIACDARADCNPLGTGMVTRRAVMDSYIQNFLNGKYTNLCRTGNSLSTGGDTQIVLNAIKEGWFCGTSPFLKVQHVIPVKRTNMAYLRKLIYGYGASEHEAVVEVFPEELKKIELPKMGTNLLTLAKKLSHLLGKYYSFIQFQIDLAYMLGTATSAFKVHERPLPFSLRFLIKLFKLQ